MFSGLLVFGLLAMAVVPQNAAAAMWASQLGGEIEDARCIGEWSYNDPGFGMFAPEGEENSGPWWKVLWYLAVALMHIIHAGPTPASKYWHYTCELNAGRTWSSATSSGVTVGNAYLEHFEVSSEEWKVVDKCPLAPDHPCLLKFIWKSPIVGSKVVGKDNLPERVDVCPAGFRVRMVDTSGNEVMQTEYSGWASDYVCSENEPVYWAEVENIHMAGLACFVVTENDGCLAFKP